MSQRWRFRIEYDGAAFCGWQVQDNDVSVQGVLEQALATVLRGPVRIYGAGRTDSGVHARGQCAHFDWSAPISDPDAIVRSINGIVDAPVAIRALEPAPQGFHARHSALWRYYVYSLSLHPMPLLHGHVWNCSRLQPDPTLMEQEATSFLGEHDFVDFCIPRNDGKSTVCKLEEFRLERKEDLLRWHIRGNRFLHRQVRSMIGLLVDVGRKKLPPGSVAAVFGRTFSGSRMWAPPEGLCLEWVEYPLET